MGQAIIAKLRTEITDFKGSEFLAEKFSKHFENGLAKSFFNEQEIKRIFKETGKYVELNKLNISEINRL